MKTGNKRKRDIEIKPAINDNKNIVLLVVNSEWMDSNLLVLNQLSNGVYGTVFNMIWENSIYEKSINKENQIHDQLCGKLYGIKTGSDKKQKSKKQNSVVPLSNYQKNNDYVFKYIDFMSFLKVALLQESQKNTSGHSQSIGKYFIDYIKSIRNELMIKYYCEKYPEIVNYIVGVKDIMVLSTKQKESQTIDSKIQLDEINELLDQKTKEAKQMIKNNQNIVKMLSEDVLSDNDTQIDFYRNYNTKKHQQRVIKNWELHYKTCVDFFKLNNDSLHLHKLFIFMEKMDKTLWDHLTEPIQSLKLSFLINQQKQDQVTNSINIFHAMLICWLKLFVDYNFLHCDFHLKNIMTTQQNQTISIYWKNELRIQKSFDFFPKAIDFSQVMTPELVKNWDSVPIEIQKKINLQLSNFRSMLNKYFQKLKEQTKINNAQNQQIEKIKSQNMYKVDFSNNKTMEALKSTLIEKFSNLIN